MNYPAHRNMNYEQRINRILNHRFGAMGPPQDLQQFSFMQPQQADGAAPRPSSTSRQLRSAEQQGVSRQPSTESVLAAANQARAGNPSVFGNPSIYGRPSVPGGPSLYGDQNRPHSTPPASNVRGRVPRTSRLSPRSPQGEEVTSSNASEAGSSNAPELPSPENPVRPPPRTNLTPSYFTTTTAPPAGNPVAPHQAQAGYQPVNPSGGTNGAPLPPASSPNPTLLSLTVEELAAERALYGPRAVQSFMVIESFLRQDVSQLEQGLECLIRELISRDNHPNYDELAQEIIIMSSRVAGFAESARHVNEVMQAMTLSQLGSNRTLSDLHLEHYTPLVYAGISRINRLIEQYNATVYLHPLASHARGATFTASGRNGPAETPAYQGQRLEVQSYVAMGRDARPQALVIPPIGQQTTVALARNLMVSSNIPRRDDLISELDLLRDEMHRGTLNHLTQQETRLRPPPTSRSQTAFDPPTAFAPATVRRRRDAAPADAARPAAAVAGGAAAPREPAEMRDLLAPIVRNLWLALRIGGLLYFFNLGGGMHWNWRPLAVLALGAAWYVVQAGLFNEQLDALRGYLHRVVGVEPPAPAAAAMNNGGGGANDDNDVVVPAQQVRLRAAPSGEAAEQQQTWLARRVRAAERSVALFLASLWPGVGEAAVRLRVEQQQEAERQRAEEDRRAAEELREEAERAIEEMARGEAVADE
jgi:hypothetical protein